MATVMVGLATISGVANAATYQYTIYGDVDYDFGSIWNLTDTDTIIASGEFTADLGAIGNETGSVTFSGADFMNINLLDGDWLTEADSSPAVMLTFAAGDLTDFDFLGNTFSSNFMIFDDGQGFSMGGFWGPDANLTVVPIPAAVWMFGSGLIGLFGWSRRRS